MRAARNASVTAYPRGMTGFAQMRRMHRTRGGTVLRADAGIDDPDRLAALLATRPLVVVESLSCTDQRAVAAARQAPRKGRRSCRGPRRFETL
jgi:hypothetical protein